MKLTLALNSYSHSIDYGSASAYQPVGMVGEKPQWIASAPDVITQNLVQMPNVGPFYIPCQRSLAYDITHKSVQRYTTPFIFP